MADPAASRYHLKVMLAVKRLVPVVLVLLLVQAPPPRADDASLDTGKIQVKITPVKGSSAPRVQVTAVVDAPPAKVWSIVSDCTKYPTRFDRIKRARLVRKEGPDVFVCEVELVLPFPYDNLVGVTRSRHTYVDGVYTRAWTLVGGDYHRNEGSWVVKPWGDKGTRSLVIYTVHAEPSNSVPDWIRNKAQKSALPDMIDRLRSEARKLR